MRWFRMWWWLGLSFHRKGYTWKKLPSAKSPCWDSLQGLEGNNPGLFFCQAGREMHSWNSPGHPPLLTLCGASLGSCVPWVMFSQLRGVRGKEATGIEWNGMGRSSPEAPVPASAPASEGGPNPVELPWGSALFSVNYVLGKAALKCWTEGAALQLSLWPLLQSKRHFSKGDWK